MVTGSTSLKNTGRVRGRKPLFGSNPASKNKTDVGFPQRKIWTASPETGSCQTDSKLSGICEDDRTITSKLEHLSVPVSLSEHLYFFAYRLMYLRSRVYQTFHGVYGRNVFAKSFLCSSLLIALLLITPQKEGQGYEKPKPVKYI